MEPGILAAAGVVGVMLTLEVIRRLGGREDARPSQAELKLDASSRRDSHSDKDAFWESMSSTRLEARVGLIYSDGAGAVTRREVWVEQAGRLFDQGYIRGECQLRHAHRTFRMDRIVKCWDMDTGIVIDDVEEYFLGDLQ